MNVGNLTGYVSRLGAVVVVAAALGGCSVIPDWMGGDSGAPANTADSATPPADQTAGTNTGFPDLADTPDRPAAPSTPDDQKQVADSLGNARNTQDYNTEQLRAGAETAAAPPPAEAPKDDIGEIDTHSPAATSDAGSEAAAPAPAPAAANTASAPASTSTAAAPVAAPTAAIASGTAPAMSGPPSGPPAVPAVPPGGSVVGMQSTEMTDSQLGFQPSRAPALDASVAQFVPQPIMSRYRQTASVNSGPSFSTGPAVPAVSGAAPYSGPAVGGPEQMTGAVVANFDALQGGAVAPGMAAGISGATASVLFPHDTTILSASAKAQVQAAAQAFNAQGGAGYVRVVGHASSRAANMSTSRHLQWDFEHSQARANSVARALIAAGVPASKVLISAVGDDNQSDEDTSRRADIFIQS
jgi:outer membrane protein OmpA-like peptidoglycan-associated protein